MAEIAIARSPLGHLAAPASSAALALHEKPFHGMVALRVDTRDVQMSTQPGATIAVNRDGEPRL